MCLPAISDGWLFVGVTGAVMCLLFAALAAFADWATRRYERRDVIRRITPPATHVHQWMAGDLVEGKAEAWCLGCPAKALLGAEEIA